MQGFWDRKSGIKYPASRAFFLSADICIAWLIYIRTYCMPIATLKQNKQSRLLYFAQMKTS